MSSSQDFANPTQEKIPIYACLQNTIYDSNTLPFPIRSNAISISGGVFGWGSAMPIDQVLNLNDRQVAAYASRRITVIPQPRMIVILDLEHPIHPGLCGPVMAETISQAFARRFRVARSMFPDSTLLAWAGGRAWQTHPVESDYLAWHGIRRLHDLNAMGDVDGIAIRLYPPVGRDAPAWNRARDVALNAVRAARAAHPGGSVYLTASLELFGLSGSRRALTTSEVRDLIRMAEDAEPDGIVLWHAERTLADGTDAPTLLADTFGPKVQE